VQGVVALKSVHDFEIIEMLDPSYSRKKRENSHKSMNYRLTLTNNTEGEIYFNPGNLKNGKY